MMQLAMSTSISSFVSNRAPRENTYHGPFVFRKTPRIPRQLCCCCMHSCLRWSLAMPWRSKLSNGWPGGTAAAAGPRVKFPACRPGNNESVRQRSATASGLKLSSTFETLKLLQYKQLKRCHIQGSRNHSVNCG